MTGPMTLDELAGHLFDAAHSELLAINIMECASARWDREGIETDVVAKTRRKGEAFGITHKIVVALKANPELALGLGLQDVIDLERPTS